MQPYCTPWQISAFRLAVARHMTLCDSQLYLCLGAGQQLSQPVASDCASWLVQLSGLRSSVAVNQPLCILQEHALGQVMTRQGLCMNVTAATALLGACADRYRSCVQYLQCAHDCI